MIRRIGVKNFKRFRDADFDLRQLTVLTGVNGGGKSTVVQALNLTHQCASAGQDIAPLSGLPGLDLGQASDVLSAYATTDEIEVTLESDKADIWRFSVGNDPEATCLRLLDRPPSPPHPIGVRGAAFTYLAAERMGPRRAHPTSPWIGDGLAVGEDGRFVAHALAETDRPVAQERRHPDAASVLLPAQTEAWMSQIVGPLRIDAQLVPRTGLATVHVHAGGFEAEWESGTVDLLERYSHLPFPNCVFADKVWSHIGRFEGSLLNNLPLPLSNLAGLDDHVLTIWERAVEPVRRQQLMSAVAGVDCSPESPNTHRNASAMRQRQVWFGEKEILCEWHAKLEPHRNRIHFAVQDGRVFVGIFDRHLS